MLLKADAQAGRVQPSSPLIFLHLPKTAGVTLNTVIHRQYDPSQIYEIYGNQPEKRAEAFLRMPHEERMRCRCIAGHMRYGVHTGLTPPWYYITVLREPVARLVSEYYYILQRPNHWFHRTVRDRGLALDTFAVHAPNIIANAQTMLLAGVPPGISPTDADVDTAYARLRDEFAVFGRNDRFDEFLVLCRQQLGWSNVCYTRLNVTLGRTSRRTLTVAQRQAIEEACRFDMALYQKASALWEERIDSMGQRFQEDVRRYKRLNRLYQTAYRAQRSLHMCGRAFFSGKLARNR